jgi:hypothetical protein
MPELAQFDNGKSIIRYFPPKGIAGFAIFFVNTPSLLPWPPASSIATHFLKPICRTSLKYK